MLFDQDFPAGYKMLTINYTAHQNPVDQAAPL